MTFLSIAHLGELACALCFLATVRGMSIDPDVESFTSPMGAVIRLNCSHDNPVEWTLPSAEFLVFKEKVLNTAATNCLVLSLNICIATVTHVGGPNTRGVQKVSSENVKSEGGSLEITNATYVNVGLYTCRSTEGPHTEKSIYIYVRDLEHLLVADEHNYITLPPSDNVVLPCKPSFPDVQVSLPDGEDIEIQRMDPKVGLTLKASFQAADHGIVLQCTGNYNGSTFYAHFITSLVNTTTIPQLEDGVTKEYDDKKGFTIGLLEDDLIRCVGEFRGFSHEATFSIEQEHPAEDLPHPEITLTGTKNQGAIPGKDVTLICSVETHVGVLFNLEFLHIHKNNTRFELEGYSIRKGKEGRIIGSTKLTIHKVEKEDEGNYTCQIKNTSGGKQTTYPLKVYDETKPFIKLTRNGSDTVLVKPGQEKLTLTANLDAYPPPEINWYGPTLLQKITSDHRFTLSHDMQTVSLTLMKPLANDTGIYRVAAMPNKKTQSPNEEVWLVFNVSVEGEPVVHIMAEKGPFLRNTAHSVHCVVYAIPKPNVFFKFVPCLTPDECNKNSPLSSLSDSKCTNKASHISNCTLQLNFTQPGNLSCSAENDLTEGHKIEEHVYIGMTEVEDNFAIENRNGEDVISDLDKIELVCGASKSVYIEMPKWQVIALPISRRPELVSEGKGTIITNSETKFTFWSTLVIEPPLINRSGNYVCFTFDDMKRRRTRIQHITVKASQAPSIKNAVGGEESFYFSPGSKSAALRCEAEGFPKPTIRWYKDGKIIDHGEPGFDNLYRFGEGKHELQFINATEKIEGHYKCVASNKKGNATLPFKVKLNIKPGGLSRAVLWIGILVSLAVIVACIFVIIYMRRKMRRIRKKQPPPHADYVLSPGFNGPMLDPYGTLFQPEALPLNPRWEFPVEKLKLGKILGSGAYGVVLKAEAIGIKVDEERTTVAVKRPKLNNKDAITALESELKIMDHLGAHVNIVNLLGACTKHLAQGDLLVIVEYCKYGSLEEFLKSHRDRYINQVNPDTGNLESLPGDNSMGFPVGVSRSNSNYNGGSTAYTGMTSATVQSNATLYTDMTISSNTPVGEDGYLLPSREIPPNIKGDFTQAEQKTVSTTDLLCWGFQIANGMEYLATRKVVHGDLATRNVLLAEGNIVKLCDFGLAKNVYNYLDLEFQRKGNERLPIKWMSIEAIEDRTFSIQSDVWAYGVVLWELFTLGRTPYPDINNAQDVLIYLRRGDRMPKPEYATLDVYNLMRECWDKKPMLRPSFKECSERLGSMLEESVKQHYMDLNDLYIDLNKDLDENRDYLKDLVDPTYVNLKGKALAYVNEEEMKTGGSTLGQDQKYRSEAEKDAIELKNLLPRPDT